MEFAFFLDNTVHGEDAIIVSKKLCVVLDGVSTAQGKKASQKVKKALKGLRSKKKIKETLCSVSKSLDGALTTIVGVLELKNSFWLFSVGDSPALDIHSKKFVLPLDSGDSAEIITQAIGDGSFKLHETTLPKNVFVLMSDGVSDNLSKEEIKNCYDSNLNIFCKNIETILKKKKKENKGFIYDNFKEDDCSCVVLKP